MLYFAILYVCKKGNIINARITKINKPLSQSHTVTKYNLAQLGRLLHLHSYAVFHQFLSFNTIFYWDLKFVWLKCLLGKWLGFKTPSYKESEERQRQRQICKWVRKLYNCKQTEQQSSYLTKDKIMESIPLICMVSARPFLFSKMFLIMTITWQDNKYYNTCYIARVAKGSEQAR